MINFHRNSGTIALGHTIQNCCKWKLKEIVAHCWLEHSQGDLGVVDHLPRYYNIYINKYMGTCIRVHINIYILLQEQWQKYYNRKYKTLFSAFQHSYIDTAYKKNINTCFRQRYAGAWWTMPRKWFRFRSKQDLDMYPPVSARVNTTHLCKTLT